MTQLERVLAVFCGEQPDVMPFIADLTYWYGAHEGMGDLPEAWRGSDGFRRMHRELGVGSLTDYGVGAYKQIDEGSVTTEKQTDGDVTRHTITTPVGSLSCRQKYLPTSHCSAFVEHYVKTVEDLRVVRYIVEQRRYEPNHAAFLESRKMWEGWGPMIVCPPRSPLSALFAEWAGIVTTCYLLADERAEAEKTMQALAEAQARALAILELSPAELIEFPDNLTAEDHASYFDRYLLPHYCPLVERLHHAGKFVGAHLDGTLRGLLNRMPETGMDFIESITPAPVGDVPLGELRSMVPPRFVLVGGLPGASFAPPWDWVRLQDYVRELLHHHKGTPFIAGTADQVPPNGNIGFVRQTAQLLEDEGKA